ncbi:MAG: zinc-ribbon domain-containing protein [Clostridia bacterium]|nr:zinc-ribbon domain-containing protein [Clostridia bacterium]
MYCNKCGKELVSGALFCSFCGAKQIAVCANCGTELMSGALFCHKCGTKAGAVKEKAEAVKAVTSAKAATDLRGLHCNFVNQFCANNKVLAFSDYNSTYLFDKGSLYKIAEASKYLGMTDEAVYACVVDYDDEDGNYVVRAKKYDYKLNLLSQQEKDRYAPEGPVSVFYTMNGCTLYKVSYTNERDRDGNGIYVKLSFIKTNLETGEKKEYKLDKLAVAGGLFTDFSDNFVLVDEDKLYLRGALVTYDEDDDSYIDSAVVTFDFAEGKAELLWKDEGREYGKPLFFDFTKKIMWTYTTESEDNAAGRSYAYGKRTVVARRIAPGSAILSDFKVWENMKFSRGFGYFDGEKSYASDSGYTFFGVMENGIRSEDWNKTGHGRAETTVVWDGKIISDIYADYHYYSYPAEFSKPDEGGIVKLNEISVG